MKTFIYKLRKLHPNAKITTDSAGDVYLKYQVNGKYHNTESPAFQHWNANGILLGTQYWVNNELHNTKGPTWEEWNPSGF